MKNREYIVLVNNNGEFEQELFNTWELIISIILSKFNNNYDILKVKRGYMYEEKNLDVNVFDI